jgi:F420H(2)-dependent quinone reductase
MAETRAKPHRWNRVVIKLMDVSNRLLYRISGGRVGSRLAGIPVLMLTTIGRKSGQPRTHALTFWRDGANIVIVASNGGAAKHPDWYFNLTANPQVSVNITGKDYKMTARDATADERARMWPKIVKDWHGYAQYQEATKGVREIPLVVLEQM